MAELSSIVEQSMADAAPETGGETPEVTGGDVEVSSSPEVAVGGEDAPVELDAAPATPEAKAEEVKADAPKEEPLVKDDLDKMLEQYGIKAPRKGQKEGTFKYSRFREVLGKEVKKIADKFEGDIKPLKERATQIDAVERLIAADDKRYLTMLSAVYPQYKKYLEPPAAPKEVKAEAPAPDPGDPMPQPDAQYPDGTPGYSPAQFHRYQQWNNRQVAAQVRQGIQAEVDKRLSPFERAQAASAAREQEMPRVRATITKLNEKWGDIFVTDVGDVAKPNPNSVLMQYMRQNPGMTVFEAAQDVYLPLREKAWQEKYDKQRGDIHKELNGRPAAADRTAGAGGERTKPTKANQSLEEIVAEKMSAADR
jgi:hypothetical protein